MSEFLVRVYDKVNLADDEKTTRLTKKGDFISAVPDGWVWGTAEATNPDWRIIASDIPDHEAVGWLAEGKLADEKAVSYTIWKRKLVWMRLDLVTGDFATWLANDLRPSGNLPDRIVSGTHDVAMPDENGKPALVPAGWSYRIPLWGLAADEMRALVERKPDGPSRPMVAGVGYVVREP